MICEMYNKMDDIGNHVVNSETGRNHVNSITLHDFLDMVFKLMFVMLFVSWWKVPGRTILEPLLNKTKKITFKCKKEE